MPSKTRRETDRRTPTMAAREAREDKARARREAPKAPPPNPWQVEARAWCIGRSAFVCLKPAQERALLKVLPTVVDRETFRAALAPYVDARTLGEMVDISARRITTP